MKILGVARTEDQTQTVEASLKERGLYGRYEGQIKDQQNVLVVVKVRDIAEKDQVREIFEAAGVTDICYQEDELVSDPDESI